MSDETKEFNTLKDLILDDQLNNFELSEHMKQFEYIDTLRFLNGSRMKDFVETGDFSHYVQALRSKRQIRSILNK